MPHFSQTSKDILATCDVRIQQVLNAAIEIFDFTVVEGHRTPERQQLLYAQGRTKPGSIVTNIDGVRVKGMHNYLPARAVDIGPYSAKLKGVDWDRREPFVLLAGIILGVAHVQGVKLRWGGDWDQDRDLTDVNQPMDLPHFELAG